MVSSNGLAKATLLILPAFGFYGTWLFARENGLFHHIDKVRETPPFNLPDANFPVKKTYTGLSGIDLQLTNLAIFFWPIFNGSFPGLSLFSVWFGAQMGAVWTVAVMEGLRAGNKSRVISFTSIWGLLVQNVSYAITMPIYCALHLFTSQTANPSFKSPNNPATNLIIQPLELYVLPISLTLGYIIPSILACVPQADKIRHQNLMAFWQYFPLWVTGWQLLLTSIYSLFFPRAKPYRSALERNAHVLHALRKVYIFAFTLSSVFHIATLTLSFTAWLLPSIFIPSVAASFHPFNLFIPPIPSPYAIISSVAEGVPHFLKFDLYTGSIASIIWAVVLNRNAHQSRIPWSGWVSLLSKVVGLTLIAGPGSAVVALVWGRDELVLGEATGAEEKKTI